MKFGQFVEYNKRNIFLHAENEAGRLVPDLFLFLKKASCAVKASAQSRLQLGHTRKANCIKFQTVNPDLCLILIL